MVADTEALTVGDSATALGPPHAAATHSVSTATSDLMVDRLGEKLLLVVRLLFSELVRSV